MHNGNHHVRERERLDFSKIQSSIQIPNLIEVQKKSYQRFLQMDLLPSEREDTGLQSVFTSVFPIKDFREMSQLDFVDYAIGNWECKCGNLKGLHHLRATCRNCGASVVTNPYQTGDVLCSKCGTLNKNTPTFCNKCGDPVAMQLKYDVNECQERGMTYSAPLKVTIRLTIYDKDPDTGAKSIRDIKEQEVFYGDIPLMTDNGTFVINGTERVIVSQLHRSPGVFFESANNRTYFLGKIIPYRGSWVEFEYDTKNILYVRIDRKRKFLGSIFLRALGMKSNEEILRTFYQVERISLRQGDLYWNVSPGLIERKLSHEVKHPRTDEVLVGAHKRITETLFKELQKAKVAQAGVTLTTARRAQILEICAEYDVLIVEDNPYGLLGFDGEPMRALRADDAERVIYLGSFSKTIASGLRVGWVLAPHAVRAKLVLAAESAILCPSNFSQLAVREYLATQPWREQIKDFRELYRARRDAMLESLDQLMPDGCTWTRPAGGFFVWLTLPEGLDAKAMAPRAIAERVAYVPGTGFYADGTGHRHMRLSYCFPEPHRIREGVRRLAGVVEQEIRLRDTFGGNIGGASTGVQTPGPDVV